MLTTRPKTRSMNSATDVSVNRKNNKSDDKAVKHDTKMPRLSRRREAYLFRSEQTREVTGSRVPLEKT